MAIEVLLPALSPTMKQGKIIQWCKKEGDIVKSGDIIAEIETDKATMEMEAFGDGAIAKILIPENSGAVDVNSLIAVIKEEGDTDQDVEDIIKQFSSNNDIKGKDLEPFQDKNNEINNTTAKKEVKSNNQNSMIKASPLAKKTAQEYNINLQDINTSSGPKGRIIKQDILAAIEQNKTINSAVNIKNTHNGNSTVVHKKIDLSMMRQTIANRLTQSKQEVPHFYLNVTANLDALLILRKQINLLDEANKITINDFIVKATGLSMQKLPFMNVSFAGDHLIQYNDIDVSVAVAIDDGLITPIVKNVDQKSLSSISQEIKSLANRAKKSNLKPCEYNGGSITISNLGMFGIDSFQAIINPPQAAILSIGKLNKQVVVKDSEMIIANILNIGISVDHRALDGAIAAKFLSLVVNYLENPMQILI